MRLPRRHFKWECVFFPLHPGEGECVSASAPCVYAFYRTVSILCQVLHPSPPSTSPFGLPLHLFTSSASLVLLPSSLSLYSVTARSLNFHDCCLFLARSPSLPLSLTASLFPHSFPLSNFLSSLLFCFLYSPSSYLSILLSPSPNFSSSSFSSPLNFPSAPLLSYVYPAVSAAGGEHNEEV